MEKEKFLEYKEIKMLMSVKTKKEIEIIEEKIECCKSEDQKVEIIQKKKD